MKAITKTQMKKQLKAMSEDEKDIALLTLYQHNPKLMSFYFGDEEYRENVVNEYSEKIAKIFDPSPRRLMTKGLDTAKLQRLLDGFDRIVFTGDRDFDAYYQARIDLCISLSAVDFLATYGGGPDEIYDLAHESFAKVCDYIAAGSDRAVSLAKTYASDIEGMLHNGDLCGMGDELYDIWGETGMSFIARFLEK